MFKYYVGVFFTIRTRHCKKLMMKKILKLSQLLMRMTVRMRKLLSIEDCNKLCLRKKRLLHSWFYDASLDIVDILDIVEDKLTRVRRPPRNPEKPRIFIFARENRGILNLSPGKARKIEKPGCV